jgi:hypothetical protein
MDAHIGVNEAEDYTFRDTSPAISHRRDTPFGDMSDYATTIESNLRRVVSRIIVRNNDLNFVDATVITRSGLINRVEQTRQIIQLIVSRNDQRIFEHS